MALPTQATESSRTINYTNEVIGRFDGVIASALIATSDAQRTKLTGCRDRITTKCAALEAAMAARASFEMGPYRRAVGRGRGVDKGFEAVVANVSQTIRTTGGDRNTTNPDYRMIFPTGDTREFTEPTIKQDPELLLVLRDRVSSSETAVKSLVLATIDAIAPAVNEASAALVAADARLNTLWDAEMIARKLVVDALWTEQKETESAFGRGGRTVTRFVFFDFSSREERKTDPAPPPDPAS